MSETHTTMTESHTPRFLGDLGMFREEEGGAMSGRRRRRSGGRRKPAVAPGTRFLRPRLPDGSLGKVVPIEICPRYSTMVGGAFGQDLIDVSAFRRVSIPRGGRLTIHVVESDDSDLGWDGRPIKRQRRATARSAPRRRAGRKGPGRKQAQSRRRKTRGRGRGA